MPSVDTGVRGEVAIPTARGDTVLVSEMGFTLPAELVIQQSPEAKDDYPDLGWGRRSDAERIKQVVDRLNGAYKAGIRTIFDRQMPGIGRDPLRMKKIALQTKVNVIQHTGFYTLAYLPYFFYFRAHYPDQFPKEESLEALFTRDITEGMYSRDPDNGNQIVNTGIRASLIKTVVDRYGFTDDILLILQANCRAHRNTGAPIVTHCLGIEGALGHQKHFKEHGVDLSKTMLAHQDRTPPHIPLELFERALDAGSFLCFDGWRPANDEFSAAGQNASMEVNADRIANLVRKGYADQLMISSGNAACFDCFPKPYTEVLGGDKPWTNMHDLVIPMLKERGVSDKELHEMTHTNPQRLMSSLGKSY